MSNLPAISQAWEVQRAAQAQRRAEVAVFRHGLDAQMLAQIDRIDSEALGDALKASLDEEVALLNYGLQLAGGQPVAVALVARKVELQSAIDNKRIARRFGA